jgi:large repetitive protein
MIHSTKIHTKRVFMILFSSLFVTFLFGQTSMDTLFIDGATLIIPKDITVECSSIPTKVNPILKTDCPSQSTSFLFDEYLAEEGCTHNYIIYRIWDIYTPCQEHFEVFQEVYVVDTKKPVLSSTPADMIAQCNTIPAIAPITASDACDANALVYFNEITQPINSNSYKIVRTWVAEDACGNSAVHTQNITVSDTQKPYFTTAMKDITVECTNIPLPIKPAVADICDKSPTVSLRESKVAGGCYDSYYLKREWTARDKTGNTAVVTQTIYVQDKRAPTFSTPSNVTVDCAAIPKAALPVDLNIKDNCAKSVTVNLNEIRQDGICANKYLLTRIYTVSDKCSNKTTKSQLVYVQDVKIPTVTNVPADATVSCTSVPAMILPAIADNCSKTVKVKIVQEVLPTSCIDNYGLRRTWTMTDACNNSVSASQIITVKDDVKPTFVGVPQDVTLEVSSGSMNNVNVLTSDNCDKNVMTTFSESLESIIPTSANGQCTKYVLRTWLATDNCNNTTTASQNIYMKDNVAPVLLNVPQDISLYCTQPLPPAPTNIFALDTMGIFSENIPVTFYEKTTPGGCNGFSEVERFWTALDACNNAKTLSQKITFIPGTQNQGLVANFGGDKSTETVKNTLEKAAIATPTAIQNFNVLNTYENTTISTVEVYNSAGQQLFVTDNFGRAVVQLNQYASGIYIMKIGNGKEMQVRKFVKP